MPTILKTFKWVLLESAVFKLLQDLLSFVSPQLLKWVTCFFFNGLIPFKASREMIGFVLKPLNEMPLVVYNFWFWSSFPVNNIVCLGFSAQGHDNLHSGQIHLHMVGLHLCRTAPDCSNAPVLVPPTVFSALFRSGYASTHSYHGCSV